MNVQRSVGILPTVCYGNLSSAMDWVQPLNPEKAATYNQICPCVLAEGKRF